MEKRIQNFIDNNKLLFALIVFFLVFLCAKLKAQGTTLGYKSGIFEQPQSVFGGDRGFNVCEKLNLVSCGNSIIAAYPAYDIWGGENPHRKTVKILRGYGYNIVDTNLAISGANMGSVLTQLDGVEKHLKNDATNCLFMYEFVNSAGAANWTGEKIVELTFQFAQKAKQKGFQKVFLCTAYATDWKEVTYPYHAYEIINPKRLIFNKMIRDSALRFGYEVIDIANSPLFKDSSSCSNSNIYRWDRLHLEGNKQGSQAFGDIVARAIDKTLCQKRLETYTGEKEAIPIELYPNPAFDEIFVKNTEGGEVQKIDVRQKPKGLNFICFKKRVFKFVKL